MNNNINIKQLISSNKGTKASTTSNKSTIKTENSLKEFKLLKKKPLPIKCDVEDLQLIILAIRNNDAKVHKVMTELLPPHIDREVITVDYINSVMRSICNQLDCIKLDRSISYEDTVLAFNHYVQSSYEYHGDESYRSIENNQCSSNTNNDNMEENDSHLTIDENIVILNKNNFRSSSLVVDSEAISDDKSMKQSSGFTTKITTEDNVTVITAVPIIPIKTNKLSNNYNLQNISKDVSYNNTSASDVISVSPLPKVVENHAGLRNIESNKDIDINHNPDHVDASENNLSHTISTPIENHATSTVTATPTPTTQITVSELYTTCWEGLIKLFIYVNDSHRSCLETLFVIEDIIQAIEKFGIENLSTPILAFAVDTFVQQAIQALTDKVSRVFKTIPNIKQNTLREYNESDISADNIEACISIASKVVIPLCARIHEHFHTNVIPNLPYPTTTTTGSGASNFGSNKLSAICNKLQDLLMWCGSHDRKNIEGSMKIPSTFPFVSSNTVQIEAKDTIIRSNLVQQLSNENENNIEYFYQQHPEIVLDNVRIIDDALELTLKEYNAIESQVLSLDLMKHVQQQLYNIVYTNISTEISLSVCGSTILKLPNINNKNEVDYLLALGFQYSSNIYEWTLPQQLKELDRLSILNEEKYSIQYALDSDLTQHNAIQQLHSILKELDDLIIEYVNKLNLTESYSHCALQIIDDLIQDKRWFIQIAHKTIRDYEDQHLHRLKEKPTIPLLIQHLEDMQNAIVEDDNKRSNYVKKSLKILSKTLKDSGYHDVNMVSNRSRFLRLNFIHTQTPKMHLHCNIIISELVILQTTKLIRAYIDLDSTHKIHSFIHMIKIFVNAHNLVDMNNGLLSITGWYILALHFLLHYEYLPNIHMDEMYLLKEKLVHKFNNQQLHPQQQQATPIDITKNFLKILPSKYKDKIDSVSLIELFDAFLRYYVEKFDIYSSVVTLRGKGMVVSKCQWDKDIMLWRLSIEDPFDCMYSSKPFDLGKSLTKNGQVTIFKALKRAIYGIRTIVVSDVSNCHNNVKKLFSKQDLIHISKRFHGTGVTTIDSFKWFHNNNHHHQSRQSMINLIDSKEYKYYELQMYLLVIEKYLNKVVVPPSISTSRSELLHQTMAVTVNNVYPKEDSSRVDINNISYQMNNQLSIHNGNHSSHGININSKPLKIRYDSSNASTNETVSTSRTLSTLATEPQIQKRIIRYRDAENNQLHTKLIHIRVDPSVIRYQQSGPTVSVQQPQVVNMTSLSRNVNSGMNDSKHLFLSKQQKNNDFDIPQYHYYQQPYSSEQPTSAVSISSDKYQLKSNRNERPHSLMHQNTLFPSQQDVSNVLSKDIFSKKINMITTQQQSQPYEERYCNPSHSTSTTVNGSYLGADMTPRSNTYASTTTADNSTTTAGNNSHMMVVAGYKDRILPVKTSSSTTTTSNYNDENKKKSSPIVPKISLVGITSKQNSSDFDNDVEILEGSSRLLYTDRSSLSASSPRFDITPRLLPSNNHRAADSSSISYLNYPSSETTMMANYHRTANHHSNTLYHNHHNNSSNQPSDSDRINIITNHHQQSEDGEEEEELMYNNIPHNNINSHSDRMHYNQPHKDDNEFPLTSLLSKKYLPEPYSNNNKNNSNSYSARNNIGSLLKQSDTSKYSLDHLLINQNVSSNDFDDVLKQYEYNNNNIMSNSIETNNLLSNHSISSLEHPYNQKPSSIASFSSSSSNQRNEKHSKSSEDILNSEYSYQNNVRLNSIIDINPIDYSPRSFYSTGLTEESINPSRINCVSEPLDIISFSNTNNINPFNYTNNK